MDAHVIRLLTEYAALKPQQVREVMPMSNRKLYGALKRGEIESFKLGKEYHIPTAPLRRKLGMDAA